MAEKNGYSHVADIWTPDCVHGSYWADDVPVLSEPFSEALPEQVDVAVIGSGYTGLNAAIETARGGRRTLVLDASDAGHGCSTRNGGQISTSVKPSFSALAARHGDDRARALRPVPRGAYASELRDAVPSGRYACTGRWD